MLSVASGDIWTCGDAPNRFNAADRCAADGDYGAICPRARYEDDAGLLSARRKASLRGERAREYGDAGKQFAKGRQSR